MTKEEALRILDAIPTKGDEVDALEMAIEALTVQSEHATCYLESPCEYQNKNIVMPSAQPEIIRCKDCKHGRPYKHTTAYVECKVDGDPIDRDSDFFCRYGERRE